MHLNDYSSGKCHRCDNSDKFLWLTVYTSVIHVLMHLYLSQ